MSFGSVESGLNTNPKRFWSILQLNSKSHTIPGRVSMPISASASTDPGNRTPLRSSAENHREIANLSNYYVASVFAHDTHPPPPPSSLGSTANAPTSPDMSELKLTKPLMSRKPSKCTENYRPISLPSLVSKVLERCVFNTSKIDCTRW